MSRFSQTTAFAAMLVIAGSTEPSRGWTADDRPKQTVRVAGVVLKWVRGDKEANWRRVEPMIREAAGHGAEIVCTTECFLDGYAIADKSIPLDEYRALGEPIPTPETPATRPAGESAAPATPAQPGKYYLRLAALARELKIHLIAGMTEADGDARYNTAVLIGPNGKLVGKYRKQKLGHESVRNTAGNTSSVFQTLHGRIGIMICADRTEPDIVRGFCTRGADYLICPSGGMFGPKTNDPILQARSRENGIHIGFVHPAEFLVTGPDGSILARTLVGDSLLVSRDQFGTETDESRVFYSDVPIRRKQAAAGE